MPLLDVPGLPGIRPEKQAAFRRVFKQWGHVPLALGKIIDGSKSRDVGNTGDLDVLRGGLLMGKITASGKYAPTILGVTTNAEAASSVAIECAAAVTAELVRRVGASGTFKLIGPPTAGGTNATQTVTYSAASAGVITCTAISAAAIAGSFIAVGDGSEVPTTLIPDGYGIKVTDTDGTDIDVQYPDVPVSGVIESAQIINWPSDTSLRAFIVSSLNTGGQFVFDHLY